MILYDESKIKYIRPVDWQKKSVKSSTGLVKKQRKENNGILVVSCLS